MQLQRGTRWKSAIQEGQGRHLCNSDPLLVMELLPQGEMGQHGGPHHGAGVQQHVQPAPYLELAVHHHALQGRGREADGEKRRHSFNTT